jgi:hypothetical protein
MFGVVSSFVLPIIVSSFVSTVCLLLVAISITIASNQICEDPCWLWSNYSPIQSRFSCWLLTKSKSWLLD